MDAPLYSGKFRTNSGLGTSPLSSRKRQSLNRCAPKPVRVTFCKNCLGMMASVSTLAASSGTTRPVCWVNFSAMIVSLFQAANIGEMAGDCRSGGHCRADQMGTPTTALTAFKVTVTGRGTTLAGVQAVVVHGRTHGAARQAPLAASVDHN